MKRLLINIYLTVLVLTLANCASESKNVNLKQIEISEIGESVTVTTSDVFTNPRIVSLETNEQSLIATPSKIILKHNHIYVSDQRGVFKFTREGRFVAKIIRTGKSSREYLVLADFQIDDDDNVLIFSDYNNSIYKYDWDGYFLGKTLIKPFAAVNSYAKRFQLADNQTFWLYLGNYGEDFYNGIITIDSEGNILNKSIPYTAERKGYYAMVDHMNFSQNQDNIYFFERYNDTIYINDNQNQFKPLYHIDFKSNAVPEGYYNRSFSSGEEFVKQKNIKGYATGVELFIETQNSFFVGYTSGGKTYRSLVSKKDGSQLSFAEVLESEYLKNYAFITTKKWTLFPQPDNSIAIPLYPRKIMKYANENLSQEDIEAVKQVISYSDDEQNPVIFIANIK